jgi:hypothetical protein
MSAPVNPTPLALISYKISELESTVGSLPVAFTTSTLLYTLPADAAEAVIYAGANQGKLVLLSPAVGGSTITDTTDVLNDTTKIFYWCNIASPTAPADTITFADSSVTLYTIGAGETVTAIYVAAASKWLLFPGCVRFASTP